MSNNITIPDRLPCAYCGAPAQFAEILNTLFLGCSDQENCTVAPFAALKINDGDNPDTVKLRLVQIWNKRPAEDKLQTERDYWMGAAKEARRNLENMTKSKR